MIGDWETTPDWEPTEGKYELAITLGSTERRLILSTLVDHPLTWVSIDELVVAILVSAGKMHPSTACWEDCHTEVRNIHVPLLAEHGLISYDAQADCARLTPYGAHTWKSLDESPRHAARWAYRFLMFSTLAVGLLGIWYWLPVDGIGSIETIAMIITVGYLFLSGYYLSSCTGLVGDCADCGIR